MIFDPAKREHVNEDMKKNIAQAMQITLLDFLFKTKSWTTKDIIFHGGTSIHVAWHSPRWSEDLDFMISFDRVNEIHKIMKTSFDEMQNKIESFFPGSQLNLKSKGNIEEVRKVIAFELIWSHPKKHGNVRVKAEFYSVEPKIFQDYHAINLKWKPNDLFIYTAPEFPMPIEALIDDNVFNKYSNTEKMELHDISNIENIGNTAVPRSIYGDKITAIAMRPYTKARDFFDMWWLKTQPLNAIPDKQDDIYDTIMRTARCYNYTDQEIEEKIVAFLNKDNDLIIQEVEDGLKGFIPQEIYNRLLEKDNFLIMYDCVRDEMEKVLEAFLTYKNNENRFTA